jgi:hypothetical protein
VAGSLGLQVAGVTVPWLRRLLGTDPLTALDWGVVGAGAVLPLAWGQALQSWASSHGSGGRLGWQGLTPCNPSKGGRDDSEA